MEFGKTLREAREAKGYSVHQLSDMTHLMTQVIEGLEAEDFRKIAAPIYGRGFVKLCCQALDLDPQPMVEEFMLLYTGKKPTAPQPIAVKPAEPVAKPAEPAVKPVEAEAKTAEPVAAVPPPQVSEPIRPAEPPPVVEPKNDLFSQPAEEPDIQKAPSTRPLSRFAPPMPEEPRSALPFSLPEIPWRLVALIAGAAVVIWLLVFGCRSLYHMLSSGDEMTVEGPALTVEQPSEEKTDISAPAEAKPDEAPAAKVPRTPKAVKPLYID